jgi:tRNA A-37 threonylcarbamoyl transferase component Bud32
MTGLFPLPSSLQLVDSLFLSFQSAVAGRYSIDREIGRGGMGIVFLAKEVHLDRPVAIKLLPPERARDASLRERFLREARLAAKLSHPNIIPIHAVDEVGDFVFYAMTYIDGETLSDRVRHRGPVPTSEGARVLREVAWALDHAHEHGLVHRDVKPDNILIERSTGRVMVTDFGIAAVARESDAGGVSGTPEFMSPEQGLGKEIDGRSDIYSLGVTGFYAFSGRLPFEGKSPTEIIAKHVTAPAPTLASLGTGVSRKVGLLVDRCLAKDPERRPPTARDLAERLDAALEQRREMPAALRAFVKLNGRFDGGVTLIYPFGALAAAVYTSILFGVTTGAATFIGAMAAGPIAGGVMAARRLLKMGFRREDLDPAFKAEIDLSREERAVEHGGGPGGMERLLEVGSKVGMGAMGVSLGLLMVTAGEFGGFLGTIAGIGATVGAPSTLAYLIMLQRRKDVDIEFWNRVWTGRFGQLSFAIAHRLTPRSAMLNAMTHRPTELSLGMVAETLFETLPKATRDELKEVPVVLRRLQEDATRLRGLLDHLNDAVAGERGDAGEIHSGLHAERDRAHAKLTDVIGAMETIRLNLLRLHAGSGSVESFTTHLGLAADVSAEIDRFIAANSEVDRALREFPRRTASTPA